MIFASYPKNDRTDTSGETVFQAQNCLKMEVNTARIEGKMFEFQVYIQRFYIKKLTLRRVNQTFIS